jgi:hypothetical protein
MADSDLPHPATSIPAAIIAANRRFIFSITGLTLHRESAVSSAMIGP